jgi:hypothetical protein
MVPQIGRKKRRDHYEFDLGEELCFSAPEFRFGPG